MIQITCKPKAVALSFFSIVVCLTLVHSVILVLFYQLDSPKVFFFVRWFDLDIEYNIPSIYSAFAIFVCSLLFLIVGVHERKGWDYKTLCWFGLAAIFLFLSLDEGFKIHENIGDIVENYISSTGLVYFPWIVPYGFAVIVFGMIYLKFLLGLPKETAVHFSLSAFIYLLGAVVFDMLGGREAELNGYDSIAYCILYTIEEFLEMVAIASLIYALLLYIERQFGHICIDFRIKAVGDDRP